jgi:hypothetical protein
MTSTSMENKSKSFIAQSRQARQERHALEFNLNQNIFLV